MAIQVPVPTVYKDTTFRPKSLQFHPLFVRNLSNDVPNAISLLPKQLLDDAAPYLPFHSSLRGGDARLPRNLLLYLCNPQRPLP